MVNLVSIVNVSPSKCGNSFIIDLTMSNLILGTHEAGLLRAK